MIRTLEAGDVAALLPLNNAHAVELSELDEQRFETLRAASFWALCTDDHSAFMLCFDQGAAYDGINFRWFKARYSLFIYIDRIVVAPEARGQGLARQFYDHLFAQARAVGHDLIVCEVNIDPPNPASDAFHAKIGFAPVGQALLETRGKTVRYLAAKTPTPASTAP